MRAQFQLRIAPSQNVEAPPGAILGFHLDDAGNTALEFGQIFVALLGVEAVETVRKNLKLAAKRAGRQ